MQKINQNIKDTIKDAENNLKDITHDDVIKEIQTIPNIDSRQKKEYLI